MSMDIKISIVDRSSFCILKWIGGGGFGQVFKVIRNGEIVACKQIQTNDPRLALEEHRHMTLVKRGPQIVAVHNEVEWNSNSRTLSFFMDFYKGKDLDRQIVTMRASGGSFTESQILQIGYQIAVALEYCHKKRILHQDIKPMNVLLDTPWNPSSDPTVPNLFVTDFGIASHAKTIGTRLTWERGTEGYQAPEIHDRGVCAAFSEKSDVYAFGCVLFRLCTLKHPSLPLAGIKPLEVSKDYSINLLSLISSMLSIDRFKRPTAFEVKEQLMTLIRKISSTAKECRQCRCVFLSNNKLHKHLQETLHYRDENEESSDEEGPLEPAARNEPLGEIGFRIKGADAQNEALNQVGFRIKGAATGYVSEENPRICAVCKRDFDAKKHLFKHLHYCR
ncbi:kinase-like protein, partial [Lojkania enalia]